MIKWFKQTQLYELFQKTWVYKWLKKIDTISWIEKNTGWFIFIILIISFVAPWGLTRINFIGFDFANTGQIGDTIGGITAPILNFVGIMLLYLTLKSQNESIRKQDENIKKQNEDFQNQRDFEMISKQFDFIQNSLLNLEFILEGKKSNGSFSLVNFYVSLEKGYDHKKIVTENNKFFLNYKIFVEKVIRIHVKNFNSTLILNESQYFYDELKQIRVILGMINERGLELIKDFKKDVTGHEKTLSMTFTKGLKTAFQKLNPKNRPNK